MASIFFPGGRKGRFSQKFLKSISYHLFFRFDYTLADCSGSPTSRRREVDRLRHLRRFQHRQRIQRRRVGRISYETRSWRSKRKFINDVIEKGEGSVFLWHKNIRLSSVCVGGGGGARGFFF